jgi:LysM repeat protein
MSTPNPLVPQGSLLEQQAKSKSTFQVAAFIVAIHVVILGGLLFLGCTKEKKQPDAPTDVLANPPPITPATNVATAPDPFAMPTNALAVAPETNTVPPVPVVPAEPAPLPPALPGAAGPTTEYTVQKGDIAYKVAKKHGVTLKQLKDANPGVDLAKLKVNQKIQMPAAGAAAPDPTVHAATAHTAKSPSASAGGDANTYTVKGGDNLSRLAKKYGTTVKAIREANGLTSNDIKVGQHLQIPPKGTAETVAAPTGATTTAAVPATIPASPIVTPGQPIKP